MIPRVKPGLSLLTLLFIPWPWLASCSGGSCPNVACVPRIQGTYSRVIPDPYRLSVVVDVASFAANCPMTADLGLTPGLASCSDTGFVITGLDLGHGDNSFISLQVTIDNGRPLGNSGQLQGIVNSRDCPLVCYEHTAFIAN